MLHFLQGSDIFNQHTNKDAIKNTLAVLMIKIINADKKVTKQEQDTVLTFYKQEFGMNEDSTVDLFNSIKYDDSEFLIALSLLESILSDDITAKAKVLHHLNSIIICDNSTDNEYEIFHDIKSYLI